MPNQTFFNLPQEKRDRIIDAALEELSQNLFANASIARIVEEAGISRGSFYQYFNDLFDLYNYLFTLIGEEKINYINDFNKTLQQADFMTVIRALYSAGISFAREHPKYARLGVNFYKEDAQFRARIMGDLAEMSLQYFEKLLQDGQKRGEVDSGVDVKVAAFLFHTVHIAIMEHSLQHHDPEYLWAEEGGFMTIAEKALYILENGLKVRA
ncbi:TetR/AcrR family transcriptional regulator [Dethiobacter alkaliphilus]|uniref:Transcriptional regulator, TetR family n=1 Tax=Dethiobacter alkaliphilus AHT 1 TaxID=555088 RepID=C0GDK0_DETAL|nr:TetR/AcrR family transcriptional regulator [Dethiobacter alkaliphilus]EEG78721.1 transcriptional regulator, TetR family [Dethiobacter alkaliphilus AHT 1]